MCWFVIIHSTWKQSLKYLFVIVHTRYGNVILQRSWIIAEINRWYCLTSFDRLKMCIENEKCAPFSLFNTKSMMLLETAFSLTQEIYLFYVLILRSESDRLSLDTNDDRPFSIFGYLATQSDAEFDRQQYTTDHCRVLFLKNRIFLESMNAGVLGYAARFDGLPSKANIYS